MLNLTHRSVLRDGEPGAAGGGTGSPGGQAGTPGTGAGPQYVTVEDFGKTAAMIRGIQKSLETINTSALTADKLAELGLLEKADDGTFHAKQAAQGGKDKPPADDPIKRELDALKRQLAAKDEEVASERRKVEQAERTRAVIEALTDAGAINPQRDHVHLVSQIERSEAGEFAAKGRDQYGSEVAIPLKNYVGDWLKANPDLMKAQGGTGTGAMPGQGARGTQTGNVVPKAVWTDMSWYARNRDKIMNGEITLGN